MKTFTHRDGALRIYDGTGTPFFLQLIFVDAGFTAPLGRGRGDEILTLNRGRIDPNMHYILGPDDPPMAPVTLSFNFRIANTEPNLLKFKQALNLYMEPAWNVGVNTWVSTKGKSQVLSGGTVPTSTTTPAFSDARKRTVDLYVLWTDPDSIANQGHKWQEVYFPPDQQSINEGTDAVEIRCSGRVYGNIAPISSFPAGTAG